MSDFFEQVDRTPVTYVVLLVYVTMAFLTDPISPSTVSLVEYGASIGILVQDGQWWRLFSAAFLHGGLIHLLLNGYCLYIIGPIVEASLGSPRFVLLYGVSALAASATAIAMTHPMVPMIGGSGALFGMFGAMLAAQMRSGRGLWDFLQFRGPRSIVTLIVLNLVIGFLIPGISNSAHIGGLIAGFVLVFSFLDRGRHDRSDGITHWIRLGWITLLGSLTFYAICPTASAELSAIRTHMKSLKRADAIRWANEVGGETDISDALKRLRDD